MYNEPCFDGIDKIQSGLHVKWDFTGLIQTKMKFTCKF